MSEPSAPSSTTAPTASSSGGAPARIRLRADNGLPLLLHRGRGFRQGDELYAKLLALSFPRLILLFVVGYVAATSFYALGYMLEPGAVSNLREGSFLDAFAFSLQTISTIGYGGMMPVTPFAHLLVTLESLSGLIGVAMTTGLVFAKFSMPRANFAWTKHAVVATWNGKPHLMLRVVNGRSSEIISASARVVAFMTAVTPEGRHVRRVVDLALTRSEQPLLYAGWLLFHTIDEASPLFGLGETEWRERDVILIATLTGIESTYAQTVHGRKTWLAEDVRFGHVFEDAIHFRDDGAIEIDYRTLHLTRPES